MAIRLPSTLKLTPTQQRFLHLLGDGMVHSFDELIQKLDDPEAGEKATVSVWVSITRDAIQPFGYDIISRNGVGYQAVRQLGGDE